MATMANIMTATTVADAKVEALEEALALLKTRVEGSILMQEIHDGTIFEGLMAEYKKAGEDAVKAT